MRFVRLLPTPQPSLTSMAEVNDVGRAIPMQAASEENSDAYPLQYDGAIDDAFVTSTLDAFTKHAGRPMFSVDDAVHLVADACKLFQAEGTLQRVNMESAVVVGDLHGQFFDLLLIFEKMGMPSQQNPYLFNGDFVDRGDHSLEVIFTLLILKLRFPSHIYMNLDH